MTITPPSNNLMLDDQVEYLIETGFEAGKQIEFYLEDTGTLTPLDVVSNTPFADTPSKCYAGLLLREVEPVIPDLTIAVPTSATSWYKKSHRLKYRESAIVDCEETVGAYANTATIGTYLGMKNPGLDYRDLTAWRTNKPKVVYLPQTCDDFLLVVSASAITVKFDFLLANGTTSTLTSAPISGDLFIPIGPNNFFVASPGTLRSYKVTVAEQEVTYVIEGCSHSEYVELIFQEPAGCWSTIPIPHKGLSLGAVSDPLQKFSGPRPGLTDAQRFNVGDLRESKYSYQTASISVELPDSPGAAAYYQSLFLNNRVGIVKKNAAGTRKVHRFTVEGGGVELSGGKVRINVNGKIAYPILTHSA